MGLGLARMYLDRFLGVGLRGRFGAGTMTLKGLSWQSLSHPPFIYTEMGLEFNVVLICVAVRVVLKYEFAIECGQSPNMLLVITKMRVETDK